MDPDLKEFIIDVEQIPLDKKKHRLRKNNDDFAGKCMATIGFDEIPDVDKDKIVLGHIFDWYLGYTSNRYHKRRIPVSKFIFATKYGKNGKRINMKEIMRQAKERFKNLSWN